MRQQLNIIIYLTMILIIAICLKLFFFPKTDGHLAYYFNSTFWICGILITIMSFNLIWNFINPPQKGIVHRPYAFWPNRRETFRIIYPAFIQPSIIIEETDGNSKRQLEFPIVDLSQEGSCFIDDGCLGKMKNFSGHIRFNNGKFIRVTGELVRKNGDHVSVQFNHPISWAILLDEQRRLMAHMKPNAKQTDIGRNRNPYQGA